MTETVGKVGQMYENRKTGKVGVIESRDDKYKTLLFRDSNGKSFNVSYSIFKKDWTDYKGDEVIKTSSQVSEKVKEAEKVNETLTVERKVTRPSKKTDSLYDKGSKSEICADLNKVVEGVLEEMKLASRISSYVLANYGLNIKCGTKKIIEVWPQYNASPLEAIRIRMKKELWDEVVFRKKVGDVEADVIEKDLMPYRALVKADVFKEAFEDVLKVVDKVYPDDSKQRALEAMQHKRDSKISKKKKEDK